MAVMASPVMDPLAHKAALSTSDDTMAIDTEFNGNGLNGHVDSTSSSNNDIAMSDAPDDDPPVINGKSVTPPLVPETLFSKAIETISAETPVVQPITSDARDEPLPEKSELSNDAEIKDAPSSDATARSPEGIQAETKDSIVPVPQTQVEETQTVETTERISSPPVEQPTITSAKASSPILETPSQAMNTPPAETQDTTISQSASLVRPREDESDVEPTAKRAKTDEMLADTEVKSDATPQMPATPVELPAPSGTLATLPSSTPMDFDANPLTQSQNKYLLDCIRKAKKIKNAVAFLAAVDPVALNIPNYPNIVKNPMDLGTMESKLKDGKYATANDLWADFETMVNNSILFNGQQHDVSQKGLSLRAYFQKLMQSIPKGDAANDEARKAKPQPPPPVRTIPPRREARIIRPPPPAPTPVAKQTAPTTPKDDVKPQLDAYGTPLIRRESQVDRPKREIVKPVRDLPYSSAKPKKKSSRLDLRFCEWVNKEILKPKLKGLNWPFIAPVDVVALNIPTYRQIVKKPMDFGTMAEKLNAGQYNNAKQYHDDAKLVFNNCYTFNAPGDNISSLGKQLEANFDDLWSRKDEWIAENAPPSEPASEDESEEEEDIVDMDPIARQTRISEIQQQISILTAELVRLSQAPMEVPGKKSKSKKSGIDGGKKQKRSSLPGTVKPPKVKKQKKQRKLSLEEKRYVSEGIGGLDEPNMRKAVQIIRNGVPALKDVHDDELELDVDEIPDDVLKDLYNFVRAFKRQNGQESASDDDYEEDRRASVAASQPKNRKKNKPMSAREQESKIALVREQLSQFQTGTAGGDGSRDDSSEDDSSSSSEEE